MYCVLQPRWAVFPAANSWGRGVADKSVFIVCANHCHHHNRIWGSRMDRSFLQIGRRLPGNASDSDGQCLVRHLAWVIRIQDCHGCYRPKNKLDNNDVCCGMSCPTLFGLLMVKWRRTTSLPGQRLPSRANIGKFWDGIVNAGEQAAHRIFLKCVILWLGDGRDGCVDGWCEGGSTLVLSEVFMGPDPSLVHQTRATFQHLAWFMSDFWDRH